MLVHLAHRGDETRGVMFSPGFEAVCCFFDVGGKEFVREPFPAFLNRGLDAIPHTEELAAGFEEQFRCTNLGGLTLSLTERRFDSRSIPHE